MRRSPSLTRTVIVAALLVAVVAASGCRWFRKESTLYAQSPETRPLEVPPDLSQPSTEGAMRLPQASVSRSSVATAPTGNALGFVIPGQRDAVFTRVGEVLAATDGVTVASRAQLLGTYDLDYAGSKFLLRVTQVDAGVYVSAVDPRGMAATGEAPARLIETLKASLAK